MGWRLKVSGYGKIENAEIATAPLTLFVGDNNSGKSYLMSLLWGIRNLGAELLFGGDAVANSEAEDRLQSWVRAQVEAAREQDRHTVQASEIEDELQIVLQERIKRNKDNFVKAIFNSSDVEMKELQIELTGLADISLEFGFHQSGEKTGLFLSTNCGDGVYLFLAQKEQKAGIVGESEYRFIVNKLLGLLLRNYDEGLNSEIYFPAARTGFMLTKDVINKEPLFPAPMQH